MYRLLCVIILSIWLSDNYSETLFYGGICNDKKKNEKILQRIHSSKGDKSEKSLNDRKYHDKEKYNEVRKRRLKREKDKWKKGMVNVHNLYWGFSDIDTVLYNSWESEHDRYLYYLEKKERTLKEHFLEKVDPDSILFSIPYFFGRTDTLSKSKFEIIEGSIHIYHNNQEIIFRVNDDVISKSCKSCYSKFYHHVSFFDIEYRDIYEFYLMMYDGSYVFTYLIWFDRHFDLVRLDAFNDSSSRGMLIVPETNN